MRHKQTLALLAASLLTCSSMSAQAQKGPEWLADAAFYQIYPSSYMDTDGDGIGDLPGITSKLDYIKSLGINALWLNPIFESGWFDGGYDIIDFYKVDPRFGTNTDLVNLVKEAHKRGIKVCLDLVAGHSSNKSEWFKQSAAGDRNDRYADYYIWSDSISQKDKHDIELRNQEADPQSSKRGAWVEAPNASRGKYYLKNYYICQPALNYGYANPNPNHPWEQSVDAPGPQAVRRELRNIMSFWFDKGVDGFRVDMAASLVKNDPDKKVTVKLWQEMRAWKDKYYPQCVLISEWSNPEVSIPAGFNIDFMIHIGTNVYCTLFFARDTPWGKNKNYTECYFDPSGKGSNKTFFDNYSKAYNATCDKGYIALPSANHDFQRPNIGRRNTPDQLKVAMTFFLTMPGVPFIYYGDEIGMKYQPGLTPKEGSRERSGTRTPMQWTSGPTAGFSTCTPDKLYFPVDTEKGKITVAEEEKDKNSLLNYTRKLLQLRHSTPALNNNGKWQLVSQEGNVYPMVYTRSLNGETYVVALNPSGRKAMTSIAHQGKATPQIVTGKANYKTGNKSDQLTLNAFSAAVYRINQ